EECIPMETADALLSRMPRTPFAAPQPISIPKPKYREEIAYHAAAMWGVVIRDLLTILSNRLAPCVFVWPPYSFFDTHVDNLLGQTTCMEVLASGIVHFVDALRAHRTSDGIPLADQVGIVICSEFGRFPYLNGFQGK